MMDETKVYETSDFQNEMISQMIREVSQILEERGYNAINQIVGYLISTKGARSKITKYERAKVLEVLLKDFLNQWDI